MKFTLAVFGRLELLRVELTWGSPTEALADLIAGLAQDPEGSEDGDEDSTKIGGGQHLHSERDTDTRYPEDRYADHYIERPFGFQPVTGPTCQEKP